MVKIFQLGPNTVELIEQIAIDCDYEVGFDIVRIRFINRFFERFSILFGQRSQKVCYCGITFDFNLFSPSVSGYLLDVS